MDTTKMIADMRTNMAIDMVTNEMVENGLLHLSIGEIESAVKEVEFAYERIERLKGNLL